MVEPPNDARASQLLVTALHAARLRKRAHSTAPHNHTASADPAQPASDPSPAARCRASAKASSCSLWFFSGLNWATLTRYRCFSLRSSGSSCRSVVSQGGYTRAGSCRDHHSCCMCAEVQEELTMTTSAGNRVVP